MWASLVVLTKVGLYSSNMAVIGALFSIALFAKPNTVLFNRVRAYGFKSCLIAVFFCAVGFFVQVGFASQSGLSGLFDKVILPILWNSSVGDSLLVRLLGLFFAFLGMALLLYQTKAVTYLAWVLLVISTVFISISFFLSGHTQSLNWLAKAAIAMHFFAFACWIGSLLPLYWSTKNYSMKDLASVLTKYGNMALACVIVVVVAGSYLVFALLGSPLNLFNSTYGGGLLLKFSLVIILLLLAARNRYSLVPKIVQAESASDDTLAIDEFRVTVAFELVFAFFILLVTATVTSLTGPHL